jgi:hypothetical protein
MSSQDKHIRSESDILRVHLQKGEGGLTEKSDVMVDQNGNGKGHLPVGVREGPTKWTGWMKLSPPVFDLKDSITMNQTKVAPTYT